MLQCTRTRKAKKAIPQKADYKNNPNPQFDVLVHPATLWWAGRGAYAGVAACPNIAFTPSVATVALGALKISNTVMIKKPSKRHADRPRP